MLVIPLFNDSPYYDFSTTLEDDSYQISIKYSTLEECWYMDLKGVTNEVDLKGMKLVGGVDLLEPYAVIELGKMYIVDMSSRYEDPNYDNMGDRFQLLYVTKDEL